MKFTICEKRVKRAGLDYWPFVSLTEHDSWESYLASRTNASKGKIWFLMKSGKIPYYQADFSIYDALVFGNESSGLPKELAAQTPEEHRLAIPMAESAVRSLNLSNAVSIVLYEARRQLHLDEPFEPRNTDQLNS
jgi:tRNA (cytidine/uridine-2'-O-)-methyltransferase